MLPNFFKSICPLTYFVTTGERCEIPEEEWSDHGVEVPDVELTSTEVAPSPEHLMRIKQVLEKELSDVNAQLGAASSEEGQPSRGGHTVETERSKTTLEKVQEMGSELQQMVDAWQAAEAELSEARSRIATLEDMLSMSEQNQMQVGESGGASPSPERSHKRARGETARQPGAIESLPAPFVQQGELSEWHKAISAADEVWRSFEPLMLDDDARYLWLLGYLGTVMQTQENTDRFLGFLRSDAQGWYCTSNVVMQGWTHPNSNIEGGCKRHQNKKKKVCIGIRRVPGTTKLEFKAF